VIDSDNPGSIYAAGLAKEATDKNCN